MPEKINKWLMAFDFGESRIGVAVANTLLQIPHPLATITGKNKFEKFDKIAKLIDKWRPSELIVGMPSASVDKEELIAHIVKFTNRLRHKFKLPVTTVSEDFSSSEASLKLNEQGVRGLSQVGKLDELSACGILQVFFSEK